jgi:hypothetical protein
MTSFSIRRESTLTDRKDRLTQSMMSQHGCICFCRDRTGAWLPDCDRQSHAAEVLDQMRGLWLPPMPGLGTTGKVLAWATHVCRVWLRIGWNW